METNIHLSKMVIKLFDHWQLSSDDQLSLLGLTDDSTDFLNRFRQGEPLPASSDILERVGHLLSIHKSLRLLFPHNRELAYTWMTQKNDAFNEMTPVEVVKRLRVEGLRTVRKYIESHL